MACERYRNALTDAAAGAREPVELEAHLAGCDSCRQELAGLRRALALVDADLHELLAAEPSPELAARIRQAAAEPEGSPAWRPGAVLRALAAAAVLTATVVVMRERAPAPPPASAAAPGVSQAPVVEAVAPAAPLRVAVPRQPHASARALTPPEADVLVPPGEAEALRRLVAVVNRDRVAPPVLGATGQPSPELAELRPINIGPISVGSIDIQPLEIVPLDPAESSGT